MHRRRRATGRATLERGNPLPLATSIARQPDSTALQLQELATRRLAPVTVRAAAGFPEWAMAPRPEKQASAAAAAGRISQAAAAVGILAEVVAAVVAVAVAAVADADQPCQSNLRRIR
ncbi:hypothetical protein PROAA_1300002 [Candidatus Propionivibrio aalborgensis]|uniref:Uncharacterized protein n=1 Tax=Candidatus Propionivibrio aalborgensis TaxID=1860101 RepID=A0A1A8XH81_9RHOO|nr:hypothetical protein PROAA_1300002 [Candidatus Propionivibrio aalborgensis]